MESSVQINRRLIVVQGPTASGKTKLAIDLAKHFKTIILSADSRQFYKEMAIGTAKPDELEQEGIPHYFIDSHSISEEVTAAQFAREANEILEEQFKQHSTIILAGGSGMFVDALINGLDEIPANVNVRAELQKVYEKEGLKPLVAELKMKDPEFAAEIDLDNPVRIIRAIEAIRISGTKYSSLRTGQRKERNYDVVRFIIDIPREVLYQRINLRVDIMLEKGLLEEVKALVPFRHLSSMQTVGYKEFFDYFDGKTSLEKAIELVKQHSRNYAKRQITWLKRYEDAIHLPFGSEMLSTAIQELK